MADIQLLLTDEGNRQALASVVEAHHTVVTAETVEDVDLYLVDDQTFPRSRDAIAARKRSEYPVFCPVVLIRRDLTPISVEVPDPMAEKPPLLVNEIVAAPVEKQVLLRTVTNLLTRRVQTTTLKEKNERLEQFASALRHELRNPLNLLDGYLEMTRETGDLDHLDDCGTAIDRMERMLEEALLVVKEGAAQIEPVPVSLSAVADGSWEVVSDSSAQLAIETERQVTADEDRLKQLLENLFRNAVEHGGTDVTVTVGQVDDGFYVEDDGMGISESARERVFEEGYSTSGSGTGLGLAVVKTVADAHGWDVRLDKGSDGGARFEFT